MSKKKNKIDEFDEFLNSVNLSKLSNNDIYSNTEWFDEQKQLNKFVQETYNNSKNRVREDLKNIDEVSDKLDYLNNLRLMEEQILLESWETCWEAHLNSNSNQEFETFEEFKNKSHFHHWLNSLITIIESAKGKGNIVPDEEIPELLEQRIVWLIELGIIDFLRKNHKITSHSIMGNILSISLGIKGNTIKKTLEKFYDKKLEIYLTDKYETFITSKRTKYKLSKIK